MDISRRTFLTGTLATGVLATIGELAGAKHASASPSTQGVQEGNHDSADASKPSWLGDEPAVSDADCVETIDCDVCVVGAGTSGYFAAGTAAEQGLDTLLIEKGAEGDGVRSSALGAIDSTAQKEQNVHIDKAQFLNDFNRYTNGHQNTELVRSWLDNSGEAIDWYTNILAQNGIDVQLEWNMPEGTFYTEYPTGHGTNGGDYTEREPKVKAILDNYITSFPNGHERFLTPMTKLISENGKVVGLYATNKDNQPIRINTRQAVIIATGGYSNNPEMYSARQSNRMSCLGAYGGFQGVQGDGIKSLMWLGAQMDPIPTSMSFNRCLLTPNRTVGDPYNANGDFGYWFFSSQPFLRVNNQGRRFHNESAPYDYVLSAIGREPADQRYWHQIWDSNWKDDVNRFHTVGCSTLVYRDGADHDAFPGELDLMVEPQMEDFVDAGFIAKADTLEELADKLGITDTQQFLDTCARQNENFDAQNDPDFGKEPFRLSALRQPPFYGTVKNTGLTLCTLDGIRTNGQYQPYGPDGAPIEGVYVVGNDCGGMYNGTYMNLAAGLNAGRCATGGRQVAKMIAQNAQQA